jgi:hypothetical protein
MAKVRLDASDMTDSRWRSYQVYSQESQCYRTDNSDYPSVGGYTVGQAGAGHGGYCELLHQGRPVAIFLACRGRGG